MGGASPVGARGMTGQAAHRPSALADFASIILGKIGASEHSELCWEK